MSVAVTSIFLCGETLWWYSLQNFLSLYKLNEHHDRVHKGISHRFEKATAIQHESVNVTMLARALCKMNSQC